MSKDNHEAVILHEQKAYTESNATTFTRQNIEGFKGWLFNDKKIKLTNTF